MKHEHEMIIAVITVSLTLLLGTVCSVFAQSNKLDSILKNAQKSLEDNTNSSIPKKTNSFPQQTIPLNRNVPNNVDVYVQTKLSYDAINQLWYFPKEVTINFTKPNKICPDRFCKQQLDEASFDTSPPASYWHEFYIYGTLKIQDKKASTDSLLAWKYYKMIGWRIKKTDIKEDIKNKQTTTRFDGILGIGTDAINNPDISFKIVGRFQEPSGVLTFIGKETTTDAFFKERFGFNK